MTEPRKREWSRIGTEKFEPATETQKQLWGALTRNDLRKLKIGLGKLRGYFEDRRECAVKIDSVLEIVYWFEHDLARCETLGYRESVKRRRHETLATRREP